MEPRPSRAAHDLVPTRHLAPGEPAMDDWAWHNRWMRLTGRFRLVRGA